MERKCKISNFFQENEPYSPFHILRTSFETLRKGTYGLGTKNLHEFSCCFNSSFSNLLLFVFHQLFNQRLDILVGLIFRD